MHWKKGKLTLKLAYLYLKYGTDTARTINDVVFLQMLPLPEWFTTAACVEITHHWRSLAVPESKCSLVDLFELLYSHDFSDIILFVLFQQIQVRWPQKFGTTFSLPEQPSQKTPKLPQKRWRPCAESSNTGTPVIWGFPERIWSPTIWPIICTITRPFGPPNPRIGPQELGPMAICSWMARKWPNPLEISWH